VKRGTHGGLLAEWAVPRILDRFLPAQYDTWPAQWRQIENDRSPGAIGLLLADFEVNGVTDPVLLQGCRVADGHIRLWWAVERQLPMLGVELLDVPETIT
jgi:hypothetical protein